MDDAIIVSDIEDAINEWRPRAVLNRTNWLYRVDALRPRDIREMSALVDSIYLCQTYAQQFAVWGNIIRFVIQHYTQRCF